MIYVWLIAIAVAVTAFFSAAEMAFIGANRLRLRHLAEAGNRTAARYLESFKQPERLLSTAMMGVTLAHIIASAVATWALIPVLGNMAAVAVTLFLTPLLLVFGEVIPKAVAREWSTALILSLFQVFELASKALSPLTWATNAIVSGALRLLGRQRTSTRQFVSREELKLLLQMEPEEADVTVSEAEMIDKIFDLGDTAVREVMVPLVDVAALPDSATPDEAVRLIGERGFSRIPVFTDRAFNIVGSGHRDGPLAAAGPPRRTCARSCARPPMRRRPSASTISSARCRKPVCSSRWSSTSTAAPSVSSPSRTSWRRSSARSTMSTTGPPTRSSASPTAATAWRGARASTS